MSRQQKSSTTDKVELRIVRGTSLRRNKRSSCDVARQLSWWASLAELDTGRRIVDVWLWAAG